MSLHLKILSKKVGENFEGGAGDFEENDEGDVGALICSKL